MEGKFKIKFASRDEFLKGSADFMKLLSAWKENESKYVRNYDLTVKQDDEIRVYELEVSLNVDKRN